MADHTNSTVRRWLRTKSKEAESKGDTESVHLPPPPYEEGCKEIALVRKVPKQEQTTTAATSSTFTGSSRRMMALKKFQTPLNFDSFGYKEDEKYKWRIFIVFGQHPAAIKENNFWEVRMEIRAQDASKLMLKGLHWTPDNCRPEGNYLKNSVQTMHDEDKKMQWPMFRSFNIVDSGVMPSWTAEAHVFARDLSVLNNFDLAELYVSRITQCDVHRPTPSYGVLGSSVYHFQANDWGKNYNSLYDDMLLEGFWPWPREDELAARLS